MTMSDKTVAIGESTPRKRGRPRLKDELRRDSLDDLLRTAHQRFFAGRSERDIARDENVNPRIVKRRLDRALELGVVSYHIDETFGTAGTRNVSLGLRIRDLYNLVDCTVFEMPPSIDVGTERRDDDLHVALANSFASRIRERIDGSDHIALAGGRAIHQLCRAIARHPPNRTDIRCTPLAGRLWSEAWQLDSNDPLERPLDCDDNAFILAQAFAKQRGTRFTRIGVPLYWPTKQEKDRAAAAHAPALPGGIWHPGVTIPNRAWVGMGAIDDRTNHRIVAYLRGTSSGNDARKSEELNREYLDKSHFAYVREPLQRAIDLVRKNRLHPFGDVANRLFVVLPTPQELPQDARHRATIRDALLKLHEILEHVNDQAIIPEWKHIRPIKDVALMAGGAPKHHGTWTLLLATYIQYEMGQKKAPCIIKQLATDAHTAAFLEDAGKAYQALNTDCKDWYKAMLENFGFLVHERETATSS
jgi:hypothetical protein